MRVLVACEYSGIVSKAFRDRGHEAYSCDILPTDGEKGYHFQGDIFDVLGFKSDWDLMIAHPPCTYLCNSGVSWLHKDKSRWAELEKGRQFFKRLLDYPIGKICVENPIPHKYAREVIGKYTQIIQPHMFGHMEQKATCLWLKNLPKLVPTNDVKEEMMKLPNKERQRLHYTPRGPDRWKIRSKTFEGIAKAMAEQWG